VDVTQQRERKLAGLEELRVGEGTVGADSKDDRVPLLQLARDLSQVAEFRRSDAAPVVAVEGQHDVLAQEVRELGLAARGRRQREVRRWLTEAKSRHDRPSFRSITDSFE